jgi:tripartite-type tricarboxylate transporter receptor subunit TctC
MIKLAVKKHLLGACVLALAAAASPASAQPFPNKPVKLIVPYPAGAPVDNFARGLGEALTALWGQPVIVDNRPGANEIIAASFVAKAPADGYTLLLGSDAAFTHNAFLYTKMPYDADKDLAPITRAVHFNMVLISRGDLKTPTLKDFVALMKKEGAKHSYGSAGSGGTTHQAIESLKQEAAFDMVHVPYKGIAPAIQDMLGGNIDAMVAGASAAIPHLPSGKVKILAIAGSKRAKALPDVPTFAESGYPNVMANLYLALAGSAGTPPAIANKITADVQKVLKSKDFLDRFVDPYGYEPIGDTPQQFEAFLKKDKDVSGKRIRALGIRLD